MARKLISFDCETCPLVSVIEPEFKPDSRIKDPIKQVASIEEKRRKWKEKLALSPRTGRVCAIGLLGDEFRWLVAEEEDQEAEILEKFWDVWQSAQVAGHHLVGYNITSFDAPFLRFRSIVNGVEVPAPIMHGRRMGECNFTDVKDCIDPWNRFDNKFLSLHEASISVLGYGKDDTGTGKDWLNVYRRNEKQAQAYLIGDCQLTLELAKKFVPSTTWSEFNNVGKGDI